MVGAGTALDAATRGLKVALVEARDFASGTSSRSSKMFHGGLRYLEQLEFGSGPRGAARARTVTDHARAAPGQAAAVPVPADQAVVGAALRRGGHLPLRPTRWREIRSGAEASDQGGRAAAGARAQAQLADRRHPLLRHRRRRRPAHHDRRAHRRALRRGGPHVHPGGRAAARGRPGHRRARSATPRTGRHRGARPCRRQRHRGVDRRDPGAVQAARPVPGARLQGRTHRGAARPRSSARWRSSCAPRSRCCS